MTNANRPDEFSEDKTIDQNPQNTSETPLANDEQEEQDDNAAAERFQNDFYETLETTDQIGDENLIEEAENDYDDYDTKSDKNWP